VIMCDDVRRGPSVFMNVAVWNVMLLTIRFFEVAIFTTLILLPLLVSCRLSFPCIGSKNSLSLPLH
jgi:hypothetical protein